MDGMHTVYCHTHGTITSSNARVGQAAQNPASKGLLSKGDDADVKAHFRAGAAPGKVEARRASRAVSALLLSIHRYECLRGLIVSQ